VSSETRLLALEEEVRTLHRALDAGDAARRAQDRRIRDLAARLEQAGNDLKDASDELARLERRIQILEAAATRGGLDLEDEEPSDESELGEAGA
jgi:hypothetical protein